MYTRNINFLKRSLCIFSIFVFCCIIGTTLRFHFFSPRLYLPRIPRVTAIAIAEPEKESFNDSASIKLRKRIAKDSPIKPIRSILDGSKRWVQLISAFYDDRAGLGKYACVRIILIKDIWVSPSQCLLLNANRQLLLSKKPWFEKIGMGMKYSRYLFREEVVSCCVSPSMRPAFVALIYSSENPSPEMLSHLSSDAILKVQYPPMPNGAPRTIINCVSATFGSPDPKRVVEWLELQRLLGMDKVEIHDINMSPETRRIFEAYSKEAGDGLVELLDLSPVLSPDDYNLLYMSPAINNCLFRNMHIYKAVAVFDLDEVIFPRYHDNYADMIAYLRNLSVAKKHPHRHFLFFNLYFYMNIKSIRQKEWTSTFTRYLRHTRMSPPYREVKSIIDPAACFAMHNHYCWADLHNEPDTKSDELRRKPILEHVEVRIGANQHYKLCVKCGTNLNEYYEERSMLKHQLRLDQRIREKFKTLGLSK